MKTVHAGERSWTAAEIFVGAGRRPNVEGLGLEEVGVKVGAARRRGRRQAAHERQDDLRRRRRRGPLALHALRRLRGRARGAQHVPAGLERRLVPRAVVHVHRSRARARGPDRGAGARRARRRRRRASGGRTSRTPTAPARTPPPTARSGSSRRRGASSAPTRSRRAPASSSASSRWRSTASLKITDLASLVHVYPTIAIAIQQIAGEAALRVGREVLLARAIRRRQAPWRRLGSAAMRAIGQSDDVSVKAYAGTSGVILAFDVAEDKREACSASRSSAAAATARTSGSGGA